MIGCRRRRNRRTICEWQSVGAALTGRRRSNLQIAGSSGRGVRQSAGQRARFRRRRRRQRSAPFAENQPRSGRIVAGGAAVPAVGAAHRQSFAGTDDGSRMPLGQTLPLRSVLLQFQLSRQRHPSLETGARARDQRRGRRQLQLPAAAESQIRNKSALL